MKILIFTFILLFPLNFFAQTENLAFTKAYPVIGWDSLRSFIERPDNYPEIYRRAGVTTSIWVSLIIDSTGTLTNVESARGYYLNATDSVTYKFLIPEIKKMLTTIKWHPSYKNSKPIHDKISLYFNFLLIDDIERGFNIIAPKVYIKNTH